MYNLRKARRLDEELSNISSNLRKPPTSFDATVTEDWQATSQSNLDALDVYLKECEMIEHARTEIRNAIAECNSKAGIIYIMGNIRGLSSRINQLEKIVDLDIQPEPAVVNKKLKLKEESRSKAERAFGYSDIVEVSIITKDYMDEVERKINWLKLERRKLEDRLLEMNAVTKIELPQATVDVLRKYNLVD